MANFSGATTATNGIESTSLIQTATTTNVNILNKTAASGNVTLLASIIINKRPTSGMTFPRIIK